MYSWTHTKNRNISYHKITKTTTQLTKHLESHKYGYQHFSPLTYTMYNTRNKIHVPLYNFTSLSALTKKLCVKIIPSLQLHNIYSHIKTNKEDMHKHITSDYKVNWDNTYITQKPGPQSIYKNTDPS